LKGWVDAGEGILQLENHQQGRKWEEVTLSSHIARIF
jgi:hypothetical protein